MRSLHEVISHFGSATALARALGITTQAISQWGETIPPGRYFQLEVLTDGWFKAPRPPSASANSQGSNAA